MKEAFKLLLSIWESAIKYLRQTNLIAHVYAYMFGAGFSIFLTWLIYQLDVLCKCHMPDKFYLWWFIIWSIAAYVALASSITEPLYKETEND